MRGRSLSEYSMFVASKKRREYQVMPNDKVFGNTPMRGLRVATDIGGTFTDVAAFDPGSGRLFFGKALSTPQDLVEGIANGIGKAGLPVEEASLFVHGTTVIINALLERKGARTALVVTEGFRDIYEMGRGNRPESYNLHFTKHVPLVERALRFVVRERVMADGEVLVPLDEASVEAVCDALVEQRIAAVGILLLNSYCNPQHEMRVKQIVGRRLPSAFVTASHELSQEYREFERCSTVAANAFVGPGVATYLGRIEAFLGAAGFAGPLLVVQSSGGLLLSTQAKQHCIRMLESGPAAGIIGVQRLCQALGVPNAIGIDMGGTTAKAGVVHRGRALTTSKAMVGGYAHALPIQTAMVDIFEVGTGGGSIARLDEGGGLRVGPESAGAAPGPACYGLGGDLPTVTDANLLLGRLATERFLGGEMVLDRRRAAQAVADHVAEPLGLTVVEAAFGIIRIAVTAMGHAVRSVATARGLEVGGFTLVAYGGAGPLHAAAVRRELGMRRLLIPRAPGHFSAFGMLFGDLRFDFVRTHIAQLATADFATIETLFVDEENQGFAMLAESGVATTGTQCQRAMDMRYLGQEHAVEVAVPTALLAAGDRDGIKRLFDAEHELRYGTTAPNEPAEIVNLRATVIGCLPPPPLEEIAPADGVPLETARSGERRVYFDETGFVAAAVFARDRLRAGHRISGPAIIEEHASTTVVPPGDEVLVDGFGNLMISDAGDGGV
jgi:N-methylhydantoinase A